MKHARTMSVGIAVFGLACFCASGGCTEGTHRLVAACPLAHSGNALFGPEQSTAWATHLGRRSWPVTAGPIKSVEETFFSEYYVDIQGNFYNERSYPRRETRSVRVGSQIR